jgi:hypothetical protein
MRRASPVALPISHSSGPRWKKRDQKVASRVMDAMKLSRMYSGATVSASVSRSEA